MKIFITGNYKNNFSTLELQRSDDRKELTVVFIHGLYGASGEKETKSHILGTKITEAGIANVAYFNSSRDWSTYRDGNEQDAFKEKTFNQERQDIIDALKIIDSHSEELIGTKQSKLWVVANSMGGTIASTLSENFSSIEKLVLCGSGTGASSSTRPILSTYPSKEYVTSSAATYTGEVLLLQGSSDTVVPLWSQDELLESYTAAKSKTKRVIDGANHNFSKINNENTALAYKLYTEEIFNFLIGK